MTKQEFVNSIALTLAAQGITCETGIVADISIAQDYVDVDLGTGGKSIQYKASALFDEDKNTIYFWELTKEQISGLSPNGGTEPSYQIGKTLFRKVKSVVTGSDGKAVEYSFDLGIIQKMFHEIAIRNGWKVKIEFSQKKASYSNPVQVGVSPLQKDLLVQVNTQIEGGSHVQAGIQIETPPQNTPPQKTPPQQSNPNPIKFEKKRNSMFSFWGAIIFFVVLTIVVIFILMNLGLKGNINNANSAVTFILDKTIIYINV